jgi:hypothetical protein
MSDEEGKLVTSLEEAFAGEDVPEEVQAQFRDAPNWEAGLRRMRMRFTRGEACQLSDGRQGRMKIMTITWFNEDGSYDYEDTKEWCAL